LTFIYYNIFFILSYIMTTFYYSDGTITINNDKTLTQNSIFFNVLFENERKINII
jgi:hypothetical protein